eukprot:3846637-Amphidinium_carterae.1
MMSAWLLGQCNYMCRTDDFVADQAFRNYKDACGLAGCAVDETSEKDVANALEQSCLSSTSGKLLSALGIETDPKKLRSTLQATMKHFRSALGKEQEKSLHPLLHSR